MLLLLDNFDSFSYNLVDYLGQLGVVCKVMRNDEPIAKIINHTYEGIILSPGPETPEKAGCLLEALDYYHQKLPVLGICLGHQAIGTFFGATLRHAQKPMHGKISTLYCQEDPIFHGLPPVFEVVRYHSLVLEALPPTLKAIGHTNQGELMALAHVNLPIWGLQFHPEAICSAFGLELLQNWLWANDIPHKAIKKTT